MSDKVWKGSKDLEYLLVPIRTIHPDPENENIHTSEQVKRMTISLAEHGQEEVLTVIEDFVQKADTADGEPDIQHFKVVSGGLRLSGAEVLGWTHVAVARYGEDPEKAPAYRIAANKIPQMSKLDPEAVLRTTAKLRTTVEKFDAGWLGFDDAELKQAQEKLDKEARKPPKPPGKEDDLPKDGAAEPGRKTVDVHIDVPLSPKIPETAAVLDFPSKDDRDNFVHFLSQLVEHFPEAETSGARLFQYLAKSEDDPKAGFHESKFFTFEFADPAEFNRFAKFFAQLSKMYSGGDSPADDLKRLFLFIDETTE